MVSNTNTANEILGNFETFLDFNATGSRKNDSVATDTYKNLNLKQVTLFKGSQSSQMRNLSKFSPNNYSVENPVIFEKTEGDSSRVVAGENTHRQANKISEMILQNNNTDSRGKILI